MRKVTYPTRIVLSEIPVEGRDFHFDHDSAELTPQLADFLGNRPYRVSIHLKPMGNVYEISGEIQTTRELPCSRCGTEVETPVHIRFAELIVIEKARPRKSSTTHVSHTESENGPFCNYVTSEQFNLAEFIHEQIAVNEPYQVLCQREDCEDFVKLHQSAGEEAKSSPEKDSPFAVLKHLKPN